MPREHLPAVGGSDASGADQVLNAIVQRLYSVPAALPIMRAQKDGVLIHTASRPGVDRPRPAPRIPPPNTACGTATASTAKNA
jgi:hypothetical protein